MHEIRWTPGRHSVFIERDIEHACLIATFDVERKRNGLKGLADVLKGNDFVATL